MMALSRVEEAPYMTRRTVTPERASKRRKLVSRKDTDTVITSMVLPRELHRRATLTAFDLNWSMAELVRQAVSDWLDQHATAQTRSRA
jgi:hypothetical protein